MAEPMMKRSLSDVVEALCSVNAGTARIDHRPECSVGLPSREIVIAIVESLRSVLFPGYFGVSEVTEETIRFHVGCTLDSVARQIEEQVRRGLCFRCQKPKPITECVARARSTTKAFLSQLPEVQELLAGDVRAAYEGDPALTTPDEAILCYPGVLAITNYRLAHILHQLDVPLLPRIITESAHSATGIDIHPGAQIGRQFFIDHGTGVVIGETCIIGDRVRLYQGVTLGAKSFPLDAGGNPIKGIPRHPIVEDDVVIYAEATILGRITVGRGSSIGGNVWLTRSVPPASHISQTQARTDTAEVASEV